MVDANELKKEIDSIDTNDKIEAQEMEEFLKSEENIKKLGEAMEGNTSQELIKEMENALKDVCNKFLDTKELNENQEDILLYFLNKFGDKYTEIKDKLGGICENIIKKQNINDISLKQFKILSYYISNCEPENGDDKIYKKVGAFIKKLYDNYLKDSKKGGKLEGAVAKFFEELQQEQINRINEIAEKLTEEFENETSIRGKQRIKDQERLDKLLSRRENDKKEIEELLQKEGELSEEDRQKLLYYRDFYYKEGHVLYRNNGINEEISNKLTDELGGDGHSYGIVGYDKIANEIDKKLNSGIFSKIDNIINKGKLPKDISELKDISEWIKKFGKNNPEKNEKIKGMISNEIKNIINITFKNEDNDKLTKTQIGVVQLYTNIKYGENIEIDGNRGKSPFGNTKNQEITNLYIYRIEIGTRASKKYTNILRVPNIDGILGKLRSKDKEHKIFKEFIIFFLKIKQPGKYFENKIGNENLEKVLKFLVSAEKYKDISVDDYLDQGFRDNEANEEQKLALKEALQKYPTIGEYFTENAQTLIKLCLEKNQNEIEINNELILQNKIKKFYELFAEVKGDPTKKEELKNLGKEILDNPRLNEKQRKEILIMLGGTFSEIETNWTEIKTGKGLERICRGGSISNLAPSTIKYTQGCNIKIAYLNTLTDADRAYPKGQEPLDLVIYIDGKPLKVGGPLDNGRKFEREGYEIYINENKELIIKKLGGDGSELKNELGSEIYDEYQAAQEELNDKAKHNEGKLDISAQVESKESLYMLKITEKEKKIINDETGYTEKLARYKKEREEYIRDNHAYDVELTNGGNIPTPPKEPNYTEYHHLSIPGCEGKLVHVIPSEWNKIRTAIGKNGRNMCFNPTKQQKGNIYELTLRDLNIGNKDKNGNIHLYEINGDGNQGNEIKNITANELAEAKSTNNLIMTSVQMAPGLENALKNAKNIQDELKDIENLFSKFENGNLNDGEARVIMKKSGLIIECLNGLCNRHNEFVQLKKGLEQRYSGESNINTKAEQSLKCTLANLDYLINATTPGGSIQKYCASFLNERKVHGNDDRYKRTVRRFRNNGIKTLLSIAGGVAAVCLVPVTGGGSIALLQMAAIMTAGGMVGGFSGQLINEELNNIFTDSVEIQTENGKKKINVEYDDPTSLEMAIKGDISRRDFTSDLGMQFIQGTATTFGCMFAGQLIGGWITKAIEQGKISPKFEEFLKNWNNNFKVENGDPMTEGLFKDMAAKIGQNPKSLINKFNDSFFSEFKGEIEEELSETGWEEASNAFRKTNTGLAIICSGMSTLATAWHCLTPGGNMTKIYKDNGISLGDMDFNPTTNALEITLDYSGDYNAIENYYHTNGFDVKNGHLEMPNPDNPSITNIIYLRKTEISIEQRSLASQLSGYGISLDPETGKGYYENISKIQELELTGKANVSINPETNEVTITTGESSLVLQGKPSNPVVDKHTENINKIKDSEIKDILDGKGEVKLEELSANDLRLLMFKACNMGLDIETIEKLGITIEYTIKESTDIDTKTKVELKNYVNYLRYIAEIKNINIEENIDNIESELDGIQQQIDLDLKEYHPDMVKELSIEINKKKFELYKSNGNTEMAQKMVDSIRKQNSELLSNNTTNFKYRRGLLEANLLEIQLGGKNGTKAIEGLELDAQEVRDKTETIGGRTDTETLISKIEAGILLGKTNAELQPYLDILALSEHGAGINILGAVIQTIDSTFKTEETKGILNNYAKNVKKAGDASKNTNLLEAGNKATEIAETYNKMKDGLETDKNGETKTEIENRLTEYTKTKQVSSISDIGNNFSHFTVLLNPLAAKNSPVMSIEIGKVDYETAYNTLKSEFQKEGINIEGDIGDYNTFIGKFNKVVDNWIRTTFGTENLQELNSPEHRALFDYIAAKFMEGRRGNQNASLTNLSQLFTVKGLQDCRLHAFTKQLFFDSWKSNKLNILEKSKTGKSETEIAEINRQIKIIENTKMVFMDAEFSGNVDMNAKYVARTEDGHMEAGSQNNVIEEHTFNLLEMPVLDAEGNLQYEDVLDDSGEPTDEKRIKTKVCYADSFYHGNDGKVYDLSYTGEDISSTIYGKKGEDIYMTTKVTDVNGKEIEIKVKPLTWSMKGRGDNITGSSIETRGPSREEATRLNNQYDEGLKKVEMLRKNRAEIKENFQPILKTLESGQPISSDAIEKALTSSDGHKVAEWQANQIKRAFELLGKVPESKKGEALNAIQTMINNTVTKNVIDFAGKKGDATEFLQTEGVFFDKMQIFNDVYKAEIQEATDQLDPSNPESVERLQKAINEYQKIFDTDMKKFFERSQQTMLDDGKRNEEYHRNNFEHVAKRFKSDCDTYLNALKKCEELGMHKQAFELRQQIKTQYNELLSHSQELLGHFINSDEIKSELKGPLGREIYAKLLSIKEKSKTENVDLNHEFGENSSKVRELLGLKGVDENGNKFDKGWSKKTVEEAIQKIEQSGLADYYATIELVYNPHIEKILMEDAVYGSISKGYYHTETGGYATESIGAYRDRMVKEKLIETQIKNGEKTITEVLLGKEGVLAKNPVLDKTSKDQINDLVSEMINEYQADFPSNIEAYEFFKATTEVLVHQTMESDTRSMGDHGINHISGNIRKLNNYLESEKSNLGGDIKQWKLMSYVGHIFHDNGYAALISKGANHRKGSDLHPFTSKMYFDTNIKSLLKGLESKGLNTTLISQAIEAHDGIHLDFSTPENIFLSRFNVSDNMALGLDKVPALQRHPDILRNRSLLYECSKRGLDLKGEGGLIEEFSKKIDKSNLSTNEKEAIKSAITELSRRSFENTDFLSIHPEGNAEVLPNGVRRINMYKAETFLLSAESCGINPTKLETTIRNAKTSGNTSELIELIKGDKFGKQIIKPLKDYQDNHVLTNEKGEEYPKIEKKKNGKTYYEYDRDIISADLLIGKVVQIKDGVKAENNTEFVKNEGKIVSEFVFKENGDIPENLRDGFRLTFSEQGEISEGRDGFNELKVRSTLETIGELNSALTTIKEKVEKGKTITTEEINEFRGTVRNLTEIETASENDGFNTKFEEIKATTKDFVKLLKESNYPVQDIKDGISKIEGLIRTSLPTLIQ